MLLPLRHVHSLGVLLGQVGQAGKRTASGRGANRPDSYGRSVKAARSTVAVVSRWLFSNSTGWAVAAP